MASITMYMTIAANAKVRMVSMPEAPPFIIFPAQKNIVARRFLSPRDPWFLFPKRRAH
jgi:hypothetical protein